MVNQTYLVISFIILLYAGSSTLHCIVIIILVRNYVLPNLKEDRFLPLPIEVYSVMLFRYTWSFLHLLPL